MTEKSRNDLIAQLKHEVQNHVDLTSLDDYQLHTLTESSLEFKVDNRCPLVWQT